MNDIERDRDYCYSVLNEYTKSESLLKHALAVETCVRAYAIKFGEDENYWGNVALLHDFDYEMYPTEEGHPFKGNEILKDKGFGEQFRNAILSHADFTGVARNSKLEKVYLRVMNWQDLLLQSLTFVRQKRLMKLKLNLFSKK